MTERRVGPGPRYGIHAELEAVADALIKESLKDVTSQAAKSDILTPWKEMDRRSREIYVPSGTPDASLRKGMFIRSYNPLHDHLNGRDGHVTPRRISRSDDSASTGEGERNRTVTHYRYNSGDGLANHVAQHNAAFDDPEAEES
jgi:hypothetical protein